MTGFGLIIYIKLVIKYWLFHTTNNKVIFRLLPVHGSDKNDSYLLSYIGVDLGKCSGHRGGHSCKTKHVRNKYPHWAIF